ncbi:hypothetical protein L3Y34_000367 [Caenorhabditis briggsae]|uniref:Uncharacterized protein n=1 Tax=Caenorhabditis briggsae TaxID=6238 RepID=A0AAE9D946_CAEBR|nr:hypothetical protein L3Y34_000367 [Caenorhabditis briggsae]
MVILSVIINQLLYKRSNLSASFTVEILDISMIPVILQISYAANLNFSSGTIKKVFWIGYASYAFDFVFILRGLFVPGHLGEKAYLIWLPFYFGYIDYVLNDWPLLDKIFICKAIDSAFIMVVVKLTYLGCNRRNLQTILAAFGPKNILKKLKFWDHRSGHVHPQFQQ